MNNVKFLKSLKHQNKNAYNVIEFPNFSFFEEVNSNSYSFYIYLLKNDYIEILSGKDFSKKKIKLFLEYCKHVFNKRKVYKFDVTKLGILGAFYTFYNVFKHYEIGKLFDNAEGKLYSDKQEIIVRLEPRLNRLLDGVKFREVIENNLEKPLIELLVDNKIIEMIPDEILDEIIIPVENEEISNVEEVKIESEKEINTDFESLLANTNEIVGKVEENFNTENSNVTSTYTEENTKAIEKDVTEVLSEIEEDNLVITLEFSGCLRNIQRIYENHISTELELGLDISAKKEAEFSTTKLDENSNLILVSPKEFSDDVEITDTELNILGNLKSQQIIFDFNKEGVSPLYLDSFITESVGKPRKQIPLILMGNDLLLEPSDIRIDYLREICINQNVTCSIYISDDSKESSSLEIIVNDKFVNEV